MQHRHDADREVSSDSAANLKESDRRCRRCLRVPLCKLDHVFNACPNGMNVLDVAFDTVCGIDVAER